MYFIGTGVLRFNKKDYGYGDKLPADYPAETAARLVEKHLLSETMPTDGTAGVADLTTDLQYRLSEMESAAREGTARIVALTEQCAQLTTERDQLTAQLTAQKATIEQLTIQLTTPAPTSKGKEK